MPLKIVLNKNLISSTFSLLRKSVQIISKRYVNESYYDVLKVPETCSSKDVRDAFITLSKKNHPDKHLNDPTMHERFIRINEAYSVLINPLSRRAYDITLNHKKKIGESPIRTREYSYYHHSVENQKNTQSNSNSNSNRSGNTNTQSSSRTNYSTNYAYGDPYTWHYRQANDYSNSANTANAHSSTADLNDAYYGIKGIKKISNKGVAFIVLLFTFFAVCVQLMGIRSSVRRSREKTLERNRKYALIQAMAKEKAKLHGNDYQINLLKKSLKGSFGDPDDWEPVFCPHELANSEAPTPKIIKSSSEQSTNATVNTSPQKISDPTSPVLILSNESSKHIPEPIYFKSTNSKPNKNSINNTILSSKLQTNPTMQTSNVQNGSVKQKQSSQPLTKPVLTTSISATKSCQKCKKCKRV